MKASVMATYLICPGLRLNCLQCLVFVALFLWCTVSQKHVMTNVFKNSSTLFGIVNLKLSQCNLLGTPFYGPSLNKNETKKQEIVWSNQGLIVDFLFTKMELISTA